ncbi:aldehyde oxidase/xanthine dehydrogenase molybdopterin binding family protein (plasmid) [Rhizobium etli 8C-3]|uniref:Aldehyde oxidase/xanthine dehydrogenase molybdopterin binding family protein n=1 Tax=Rhizobium etli 8C-3 TaxID=538025 RepID=A0A1L5PGZ9_RHIET|nr:molybdopterin cofactor-binding domain-containing protein [Rhizobium etli]APO79413.1 aldehyde oxidase/xanthine dehydrogenase molybdopterin binding family protein [Rhizobium etli 8C-3]
MNQIAEAKIAADAFAVNFTLDGEAVAAHVHPARRLCETLREEFGCKDVKVGCNAGDCGACTILLDGEPVCSCTTASAQANGRAVETLRGLVDTDAVAKGLAEAFQRHGAAQCGICTPGVIVTATALLRSRTPLDETVVQDALGGVLCRCTGYRKIIDAILDAGGALEKPKTLTEGGVGAAIARIDGLAKVTGREAFGDDVAPDDALALRVIRSPYAHAAFAFGDLKAWRAAHPGVELVLTAKDIPGKNCFGVIPPFADQPVFAESVARFRGEAVAAVVGEANAIAALDLDRFPIAWEERKPAMTVAEALLPDAAVLHGNRAGNVMCGGFVQRGDVEAGFAAADIVVEGDFSTGFVEHAYIEPEAGYAMRTGNRLEIYGCTQAPFMDRDSMAEIMGLSPEDVRVVPSACGGGFGSKLDLSIQPYIGLAAWLTNRPARMAYSRTESMQSTTKRHPSEITIRIGATQDGKITALEFNGDFNTGAYASWGPTVANRVPVHASGPYFIENYRARSRAIHTHCPPSGAFRGFGVPQAAVAQESMLDELALKLGMDRLELRQLNALDNGQPTVTGQIFDKGVGISACLEALRPAWDRACAQAKALNAEAARSGSPLRWGTGIASGWYGCGNTSLPNPSIIKAGIRADGTVVLHQGATDIGQGSNTVIAQIFATALGVPVSACRLVGPDTDLTPDAGKTSASRQTYVSGNAARLCGEALRKQILRLGNVSDDAEIKIGDGVVRLVDGEVRRTVHLGEALPANTDGYVLMAEESYDPPTRPLDENGQGHPYAVFGYAAQLVELSVDMALGTVKLRKFTAAHDVGKAINPLLIEGQIQGGIAQGVGFALMEEFVPGRTENLHDYLIPTFGDIPPVETLIVEVEDGHGPYGAKGLGEHVLIPTAPAILNAIRDAAGVRLHHLPATPAKVMAAIRAVMMKN